MAGFNINQLPTAASSILATDKLYLGRSPYGLLDDRYILGSSILAQLSPLTTKGDLLTFTTVNARLPVGTNGQILKANNATGTGLEWVSLSTLGVTSITADSGLIVDTPTGDVTIGIDTNGVTYGLFQKVNAATLVGNPTGGVDDIEAITLGTNLSFTGSVLNAANGSVTITADSGSATGSSLTLKALNGANACGAFVSFSGASNNLTLKLSNSLNILLGENCGNTTMSGNAVAAFGVNCLRNLTSGFNNVAGGTSAMLNATTAARCVAFGDSVLSNLVSGIYTIALGQNAGLNNDGNESSNIYLNSEGLTGESNCLRLGSGTGTGDQQLDKVFISGINSVTSSNAMMVTINATSNQLGTAEIIVRKTTKVTASPYTILVTDDIILVDTVTIGAASTIELPNFVGTDGQVFTIKDFSGDAANNPITIDGNGWDIDAGTTVVLNQAYQSISICWDLSEMKYSVVSEYGTRDIGSTLYITSTPTLLTVNNDIALVDTAVIGAPSAVELVNFPILDGQTWTIKDYSGASETYPITVSGNGNNIDGLPNFTINKNFQSVTFCWDKSQAQYSVISDYTIVAGGGAVSPENNVYVALNGNDANPGTFDAPYLTVAAAIASVVTGTSSNPVNVIVAPGTYTEAAVELKAYVNLIGAGEGATYFDFTAITFDATFLSTALALITLSDFTLTNATTTLDFSTGTNGDNCIVTLNNIIIPNDITIENTNDNYAPQLNLNDVIVRGDYTHNGYTLAFGYGGFYSQINLHPGSAAGIGRFKGAYVDGIDLTGIGYAQFLSCPAFSSASLALNGTGCNVTIDALSYRNPSLLSGATDTQITYSTSTDSITSTYVPTNFSVTNQVLTASLVGIDNALGALSASSWTNVTGTTQLIAANTNYVTNNAATVTYTLPASPAFGDTFKITGGASANASAPWIVAQNASQQIFFGNLSTTVGVTGSLAATNKFDSIELVCVVAGGSARWTLINSVGNVTVS